MRLVGLPPLGIFALPEIADGMLGALAHDPVSVMDIVEHPHDTQHRALAFGRQVKERADCIGEDVVHPRAP